MTEKERSAGFGKIAMNAALALTASWLPTLALMEGAAWATPKLAGAAHFFALGFMVAAPLAHGGRIYLRTGTEERSEAMRDWVLRGLLPPLFFATAVQTVLWAVPHVTMTLVVLLMFAGLPLGLYGLLLLKDARAG